MPLRIVWRSLLAHPLRSILTFGSLVIALFLLCFLRAAIVAMESGVEGASSQRLIVQSAVSLFVDLPLSYQGKIETVPGVAGTCKWTWFGGIYQRPENFFAQFAVDKERLFATYPEIEIAEGSRETFLRERQACLVGADLASRFGFRVGQSIPLQGTIYARPDGQAWDFTIAGIYRSHRASVDEQTMFFHHDYLEETFRGTPQGDSMGAGVYVVRLEAGAEPSAVMASIDALFENGPQRVQTTTEAEFQRQFVTMLGNVPTLLGFIGGGVLFAIFLAVLNTMIIAARERTKTYGVLKAMGFRDGSIFGLLLVESLVLCLAGGALGIGLSVFSEGGFRVFLNNFFPGYRVTPETIELGLALAAAIGFFAAVGPAWTAARLRPVEALRAEH